MDNILAAEVVTAKGQIVWASKEENEDLFWCIRGAGNKFGVVTKVCYTPLHMPLLKKIN